MATTIWLNDRAQEIFQNHRKEEERPFETIIRLLGDESVAEDQGEEIVESRIRASTS